MKNRISVPLVGSIIIFAIIGIIGTFTKNPVGFLQRLAVIALVGLAIYFVFRKLNKANPQKKEQQAFLKAAKRSKKRMQHKSGDQHAKTSSLGSLTSIKKKKKKKAPVHLTVIEGKKSKKKNRASL